MANEYTLWLYWHLYTGGLNNSLGLVYSRSDAVKSLNRAIKRGPRLPAVDQNYVVKAKRDTSPITHPTQGCDPFLIHFRLFGRIFIAFLEKLIYINLKLQIASIYIYT